MFELWFVKRLEKILPDWEKEGWVAPGGGQAILKKLSEESTSKLVPLGFSFLGAALIGAGVISFFAANWEVMPKALKLAVLMGGMWGVYALAAWAKVKHTTPVLSEGMLLLGVILYGSNIMLIAQIYHIDSHYPDGVMAWALGALLTAWLMKSHPIMCLALGLGLLWTGMEFFEFGFRIHLPFLPFAGAALFPIIKHRWQMAFHLFILSFGWWSWQTFIWMTEKGILGSPAHTLVVFLFLGLTLHLFSGWLKNKSQWHPQGKLLEFYSLLITLGMAFALTFPFLHALYSYDQDKPQMATLPGLLAFFVLMGGSSWVVWKHLKASRPHSLSQKAGLGLYVLLVVLSVLTLFLPRTHDFPSILATGFNLLTFAGLGWLAYISAKEGNQRFMALAFLSLAVLTLARYLDPYWGLMVRSLFFIPGGVLVLGGGYWLEKFRKNQQEMKGQKSE